MPTSEVHRPCNEPESQSLRSSDRNPTGTESLHRLSSSELGGSQTSRPNASLLILHVLKRVALPGSRLRSFGAVKGKGTETWEWPWSPPERLGRSWGGPAPANGKLKHGRAKKSSEAIVSPAPHVAPGTERSGKMPGPWLPSTER